MDQLTLLTANSNGTGSAAALPMLCRMLAKRGLLTSAEIEELRHAALLGFDKAREHRQLSEEESEFFELARKHADSLWQSAALEAERQG